MTRVIDTSAWIEWLADGPLADDVRANLPPQEACIVPTIVQLELAKWLSRELSAEAGNKALAYVRDCKVVVLDSEIALLAAELCRSKKLATADSVIYATSIHLGAELLTCDGHFEGFEGVIYLSKRPL